MVPKRRDTPHGRSDGLYTDRQKGKKPDCEGVCAPFFCVLTVLCLKRKDNEIQQNNKEKQQNRKTTNEQDKRNKRKEKRYSSIHVYIYIFDGLWKGFCTTWWLLLGCCCCCCFLFFCCCVLQIGIAANKKKQICSSNANIRKHKTKTTTKKKNKHKNKQNVRQIY